MLPFIIQFVFTLETNLPDKATVSHLQSGFADGPVVTVLVSSFLASSFLGIFHPILKLAGVQGRFSCPQLTWIGTNESVNRQARVPPKH